MCLLYKFKQDNAIFDDDSSSSSSILLSQQQSGGARPVSRLGPGGRCRPALPRNGQRRVLYVLGVRCGGGGSGGGA